MVGRSTDPQSSGGAPAVSANRMAETSATRCLGFFCRQRCTNVRRSHGTSCGRRDQSRIGKIVRHAVAIGRVGDPALELRPVVLRPRVVNVCQQLAALPDQMEATAEQVARRPHASGIHIGLGPQSAAQEARDLVRVNLVVLGFPTVDRLHRQRVAEHERDLFGGADVCEPIPREHALGGDDQIVPVRGDDLEERLAGGCDVAMHDTWPAASRLQTYRVFTWRSIPQ